MIYYERIDAEILVSDDLDPEEIWEPVATNLPCDLAPTSTGEGAEVSTTSYTLHWRGEVDLTKDMRITWRGMHLEVEGETMKHYVKGRLHHAETRLIRYSTSG